MKTLKHIIPVALLLISFTLAGAQNNAPTGKTLADYFILNREFPLPFNLWNHFPKDNKFYIQVEYFPSSIYDGKIYTDNQCKKYKLESSIYGEGVSGMYATWKIPNSNCYLCLVCNDFGPNEATDVMLIVDKKGKILDELVASVSGESYIIKQYTLNRDFSITIHSIIPSSSKSVDIWEKPGSFTGYRQDDTYKIVNNKFVLAKTKKGKKRTINSTDFREPGQYWLMGSYWGI